MVAVVAGPGHVDPPSQVGHAYSSQLGAPHAPGHILVKFKPRARAVGTRLGNSRLRVVPVPQGSDVAAAVAEYRQRAGEELGRAALGSGE